MAAIPLACAAIAVPEGEGLVGFFVRKETKSHGLQRMVEGPVEAGAKVLVVEDTVTTGGSTVAAVERIREQGLEIVGGVCVVDRLAGGGEAIAAAIGGARSRPWRRSTTSTRSGPTARPGGRRRFSRRITRPSLRVQTWKYRSSAQRRRCPADPALRTAATTASPASVSSSAAIVSRSHGSRKSRM